MLSEKTSSLPPLPRTLAKQWGMLLAVRRLWPQWGPGRDTFGTSGAWHSVLLLGDFVSGLCRAEGRG